MTTYKGSRTNPCTDIQVTRNGAQFDPRPSQNLWNHSPDGFNWGFGGSGSAQLALAILFDVTDDKYLAIRLYQDFKNEIIAHFADEWEYYSAQARVWVDRKESESRKENTQFP